MKTYKTIVSILLLSASTLVGFSQAVETDEDFSKNIYNTPNDVIFRLKDFNNAIANPLFIEGEDILKIEVEKLKDELATYNSTHPKAITNCKGYIDINLRVPKDFMNLEQLLLYYKIDKKYWNYTFYYNCAVIAYPKEMWSKTKYITKVLINHKIKGIKFNTHIKVSDTIELKKTK